VSDVPRAKFAIMILTLSLSGQWMPVFTALVGASVGFIFGIAGEPLKSGIANRKQRKRMRFALYHEIIRIYDMVRIKSKEQFQELSRIMRSVGTPAYDYARSQPVIFYELDEAGEIDDIYAALRYFEESPGMGNDLINSIMVIMRVEEGVREEKLDTRLMKQINPNVYSDILQGIKDHKTDDDKKAPSIADSQS
jgi:hypothetical protein